MFKLCEPMNIHEYQAKQLLAQFGVPVPSGNVATTPADNAPPELTANDDEACTGEWIRLRVDPRATSYIVEVHGKGTQRTYAVQ